MFLRSFSFIGNHSRNSGYKSGFARHAARLFAHVDDFLFPALHVAGEVSATYRKKEGFHIDLPDLSRPNDWSLEIEQNLQIDSPVCRGRRKRTARQRIGLAKQR